MLSEGIHSLADVSNQVLLALGISRSKRDADAEHPYGYGRAQFVWALISAVGIFFIGCGVTVYHGVTAVLHPHPIESPGIAAGVLLFALIIEGYCLLVALGAVRHNARRPPMGSPTSRPSSWFQKAIPSQNPSASAQRATSRQL